MTSNIAIIPVKHQSERVENKNFKPFSSSGQSLFDLLVDKLSLLNLDHIYVSTNSPEVKQDSRYTIIPRDDEWCNNITPWSDVIVNVLSGIPEPPETNVLWCHTTTPLFKDYSRALDTFLKRDKNEFNSLVVVERLKEFILSEHGLPVNYAFGPWHKYSQFLPSYYRVVGSLFIGQLSTLLKHRYVFASNPILFETDSRQSIDIDTPFDFEMSQYFFNHHS
ncbi:hypothetical protein OAZ88_00565 [bacterium]|nr:hypothetical protein [bacterium]